tara:strand:- start:5191 stop:7245 length:2055 start_codon:yes stop_codon:yes gene_type:complete
MTTNIDSVFDSENIDEALDYDNLTNTILDLSLNINTRMKALDIYYSTEEHEILEIISRLNTMYQMSGIHLLEDFLIEISKNRTFSVILRLEAVKGLLSYTEKEYNIPKNATPEEIEEKNNENTIIKERNNNKLKNSSKVLSFLCEHTEELPTPCRVEALHILMKFPNYFNIANKYFIELINDITIDCNYRYSTILGLENKSVQFIQEKLILLFDDKKFVKHVLKTNKNLIEKEFPGFKPTKDNQVFFELLITRLNFDILLELCNNFLENISNPFEKYLFNAQLNFLKYSDNDIYYRILAGQYLLQKFDQEKEFIEKQLLEFAQDINIEYDRRADAADILIQLGSTTSKENGRKIIMELGNIKGKSRTVFENAQNVHVEEVESSVLEVLEFFATLPIYKINDKSIDFNYVKKQIEDILIKDKNMLKPNLDCIYCGNLRAESFCSENCKKLYERENKINVSLNRINMDRALYSKYNSSLVNILIKVWSYLINHEHENEMKKRLLEELEEMAGTCSSGFASRLINSISGFGDFNIRISWEDQIISNFSGRLNAYARKINDPNSIFYKEKYIEILSLWLNSIEQQELKDKFISEIKQKDPKIEEIVEYYLKEDKEEKIESCIEDFSFNILNELTIESSKAEQRLQFSLFFRTYVAEIREEMYQEFKEYLDDASFDLYMRKALMSYEGI